jgi:hypothetical protein
LNEIINAVFDAGTFKERGQYAYINSVRRYRLNPNVSGMYFVIILVLRKQPISRTDECVPYIQGRSSSTDLLITESLYNKRFESKSVQIAFLLKANDRLNKEQEEKHKEKKRPRGSKKIMCSGITRRIRMTKKNLKREICW